MLNKRFVFRIFSIITALAMLLGVQGAPRALAGKPSASIKDAQKNDQCLGVGSTTAHHNLTGKIRFLGTQPGNPIQNPIMGLLSASPEEAARGYFSQCGSMFGINDQASELIVKRQSKAEGGRSVIRFEQTYKGIPVIGAELVVQLNSNNDIVLINGDTLPRIRLNTQPLVDAATARQTALQIVANLHGVDVTALKTVGRSQLRIYSPALIRSEAKSPALVWQLQVTPVNLAPIRELVLIDAHSGELILNINQVDTAKNRGTYTANNDTTIPGTLVCNESDPTCSGAGSDTDAKNAHQYAGETYDFYFNYHNRDSINNAGMDLISTVHYDSNYCNAFWTGLQMVYGDGCTIVTDDVVAHEYTHGVTEFTSGLIYQDQSGAINESFSDIWGEFVDLTNTSGNDDASVRWLVGEDVNTGVFRNMKDPTAKGHPDRMDSPYYYHGDADHGGVHTNSGVGNKAAYLITDGDTFNGYTVTGLGITKAAKIYYEAQTNILTSTSDYYSLHNALYQACTNLIGISGITAEDCTEVQEATLATEMNLYPTPPPPANDDINTPEVISNLPYIDTLVINATTTDIADPVFACTFLSNHNTVWYKYTPATSKTLAIDTFGSNYDTVLAVWAGSPGSLTSIACNDDYIPTPSSQSKVIVPVIGGTTYYIEVASYYEASSGNLTLSVNDAANLLQDSSFETYTPNSYWAEASTNFGTPLCNTGDCGAGGAVGAGPRTGSIWAWFGGTSNNETGSLSQTITIPSAATSLKFYLWIGFADVGSDAADAFRIKIDGTTVFTANATQKASYSSYKPVQIDVSAYADGGSHTVTLSSVTTGQAVNFNVDDVTLLTESAAITKVFYSDGSQDGWILESTETSNAGGTQNNTLNTIRIGDESADKQYRSILSFNTAALPDNAIISSVRLKFKQAGITGTSPFGATHGNLLVDMRKDPFSNSSALQLVDFNASASKNSVLTFTSSAGWQNKPLGPANFMFINRTSLTQFRLRFSKDDNDDNGADYLTIYSGNAAIQADRPQLVIKYYMP